MGDKRTENLMLDFWISEMNLIIVLKVRTITCLRCGNDASDLLQMTEDLLGFVL